MSWMCSASASMTFLLAFTIKKLVKGKRHDADIKNTVEMKNTVVCIVLDPRFSVICTSIYRNGVMYHTVETPYNRKSRYQRTEGWKVCKQGMMSTYPREKDAAGFPLSLYYCTNFSTKFKIKTRFNFRLAPFVQYVWGCSWITTGTGTLYWTLSTQRLLGT